MLCNRCWSCGAGSAWEKPSWEPSLGLEKSTPKLLGLSALQGDQPWCQSLSVLSLKWRAGGKLNFCEYLVVKLSSVPSWGFWGMVYLYIHALFLSLGQNLPWRMDWLLCLGVAWDAKQDLFLISSLSPGREGASSCPTLPGKTFCSSICRAVCEFERSVLRALPSVHAIIFATMWLKVDYLKKRANRPWDDCLREFMLPDVNERVDFSRPGVTHIKTIDIIKCMDICTWH